MQKTHHQNSPFIAEAQAVLADLHYRKHEPVEGQALLKASRYYWDKVAEVPSGSASMEQLAPTCSK